MSNEQLNSEAQSAIRELNRAELDAVSGARLESNSPLPGPSPTFPPVD